MAWAAGLVPPGDPARACHRSPRRWNHKRPRFSLGVPHGVGPLPWPASWHRLSPLGRSMSSALLGCHGTLRRRRNLPSKRLPRAVSWRKTSPLEHSAASAGGCAVDRAEGDRFAFGAVPLGAFRGKYVVVGSKGGSSQHLTDHPWGVSGHACRGWLQGRSSRGPRNHLWGVPGRVCHGGPRRRTLPSLGFLPWPVSRRLMSPSGSSAPSGGCSCRGTLQGRRNLPSKRLPWPVSRQKMSPLGGSAPAASCHLPAVTCSQANSPDRNANLGAQDAELCDSDKSVFPNLLRPVQRGRQRSW